MLNWLPERAQKFLSWSPLVQSVRDVPVRLFGPDVHAKFSLPFMVVVCTITTTVGLAFVRAAQKHVEV